MSECEEIKKRLEKLYEMECCWKGVLRLYQDIWLEGDGDFTCKLADAMLRHFRDEIDEMLEVNN